MNSAVAGSSVRAWRRLAAFWRSGSPTVNNTLWLILDKVLRLGVGVVVGAIVSRYLLPEGFGVLAYATSFAALFANCGALAAEAVVVRDLARFPAEQNQILGSALLLRFAGTVLAALLATLCALWFNPGESLKIFCIGISSLGMLVQVTDTFDSWFQARLCSRYTVWVKNAAFLLLAGWRLWLVSIQAPVVAFAWAGLAELTIGAIGVLGVYRWQAGPLSACRFDRAWMRRLARDSWPFVLSGTMIMVYMRIDQVMIEHLSGTAELGIYAMAVRYAEVWYFIPMSIQASVLPGIARLVDQPELFYDRLQRLYNLMAFLAYAVALPVTFLAPWLIRVLNGEEYARAAPMLSLLIWSSLFTNLGIARSVFLTSVNWPKVHMWTTLLGCAVNVGLNWLWIPKYGALGAVWATAIAYWLQAHGSCFLFKPLWRTGGMLTRALIYPKWY